MTQQVMEPAIGHGCMHCESGRPRHKIVSEYGTVVLCSNCAALWWHGKVPLQLEFNEGRANDNYGRPELP